MSSWTNITATFDVDTFHQIDNLKQYVEEKLKDAPEITGSECNAQIFVNVLDGHNWSTSADCARCKYSNTIEIDDDIQYCSADCDFDCPEGVYQTRVLISIIGDLRDRQISETREQYENFRTYIDKLLDWEIRNESINIKT